MHFGFIFLGFIVAVLVAMTGVGGGSLMAPVLILVMNVAPGVAVGTDLLYSAVTRAAALCVYSRERQVEWRLAGRMLIGSLPGATAALAGLWLFGRNQHDFATVANVAISVALTASAGAILFRERLRGLIATTGAEARHAPVCEALTIAAGAVIGVLVSLSSVGAGALGVTLLMLLFPSIDARHLVGTDLAHGVALALAAGLGHMLVARADFAVLGQLLVGTLPGIYVGTRMAGRLSETALRRAIAVVLLGIAVKLVA